MKDMSLTERVVFRFAMRLASSQLPSDGMVQRVNDLGLTDGTFNSPLLQDHGTEDLEKEPSEGSMYDISDGKSIPKIQSRPMVDARDHQHNNISYNVPKIPSHVRYR